MVVFRYLTRNHLKQILNIQIRKFHNDLINNTEFPIILRISDEVKEFIINESGDRMEYGARLLRKKFEEYLISEIGRRFSSGELQAGDEVSVELVKPANEKSDKKPYVDFYYSKKAREKWNDSKIELRDKILNIVKKYSEEKNKK